MPPKCSICSHEKRREINELLVSASAPLRNIAFRYATTSGSLFRHRKNCLPSRLATGIAEARKSKASRTKAEPAVQIALADLESAQGLFAKVRFLIGEALDMLAEARADGDRQFALKALREARETIALLGRAQGFWTDASMMVDARRQTVNLFGELSISELRALAADVTDNRTLSRGVPEAQDALEAEIRPESQSDVVDAATNDAVPSETVSLLFPNGRLS